MAHDVKSLRDLIWKWSGALSSPACDPLSVHRLSKEMHMVVRQVDQEQLLEVMGEAPAEPVVAEEKPKKRGPGRPRKNPKPEEVAK